MKILKEVDIKSRTWGYVTRERDGKVVTGYVPGANRDHTYRGYDYGTHRDESFVPRIGKNVIMYGSVKVMNASRGRSAAGADIEDFDGYTHYMSIGNLVDTIKAIADERLKINDTGWIYGHWTLTKQGNTISLTPYSGDPIVEA
jgi:hypothetical protein